MADNLAVIETNPTPPFELDQLRAQVNRQKLEITQLKTRIEILVNESRQKDFQIKQLEEKAAFDDLTDLYRRTPFERRLTEELVKIKPADAQHETERRKEDFLENVSIILLDADNFKVINDSKGHEAGDITLKKMADILQKNVRKSDIVCRWGGEEMVVALIGADEEAAATIAEELRGQIETSAGCTVSVGVAAFEEGLTPQELIRRADQAMYKAKHKPGGRNCVERFSQLTPEDRQNYTPEMK